MRKKISKNKILNYHPVADLNLQGRKACVDLLEKFFAESNLKNITRFSRQTAYESLAECSWDCVGWVAFSSYEAVAICIFNIASTWTIGKIGYEEVLYVDERFRDKDTADMILSLCDKDLQDKGVRFAYMTSTAGFKEPKANSRAFRMLCRKHGFEKMEHAEILTKTFDTSRKIGQG